MSIFLYNASNIKIFYVQNVISNLKLKCKLLSSSVRFSKYVIEGVKNYKIMNAFMTSRFSEMVKIAF